MGGLIIQHAKTKMFLAKNEDRQYRNIGAYKLMGAAQRYRWSWKREEAIRFENERDADLAWIFMREPHVYYLDAGPSQ